MSRSVCKRVLLIAGPTASGKSALALQLAREDGGIIINADAMQVYRELQILTARPSLEDESQIPHRLYGHVSGTEAYSVARWLEDVAPEISDATAAGVPAIIVGGTGLYFKALEQGLADVPPIPEDIREKWRSFTGDLQAELLARDPLAATALKAGDRQRLVRALEVLESTGKPLRTWQREAQRTSPLVGYEVERVFLNVPRETLYARAEARFDWMLQHGAIDEVRRIMSISPELPMARAIGVAEIRGYLLGEQSLEEAAQAARTATRQYIKRQLTWWRNQMGGWQVVESTGEE